MDTIEPPEIPGATFIGTQTTDFGGDFATDFGGTTVGIKLESQRRELVKPMIEKFYDHMGYPKDDHGIDLNLGRFKVEKGKYHNILSFEKNGKWYNLTDKNTGEFRTTEQIQKIITRRIETSSFLGNLDDIIPTAREAEQMSSQELIDKIGEVRDIGVNTDMDMREILGLNAALQRWKGEIVNSVAKLSEVDTAIERQTKKLEEALSEDQRQRIEKRLADLKLERAVRVETVGLITEKCNSQLDRMRQTIDKLADGDRTLKERLKILWREQGVTIVSVLSAIGLLTSTLLLALTGGGGGGGGKTPHKVRDWVKKSLKSLSSLLGRLAKWALSALPGALGSFLSWLLNLLKTVVIKAAEHAYATVGFLVASATYLVFRK